MGNNQSSADQQKNSNQNNISEQQQGSNLNSLDEQEIMRQKRIQRAEQMERQQEEMRKQQEQQKINESQKNDQQKQNTQQQSQQNQQQLQEKQNQMQQQIDEHGDSDLEEETENQNLLNNKYQSKNNSNNIEMQDISQNKNNQQQSQQQQQQLVQNSQSDDQLRKEYQERERKQLEQERIHQQIQEEIRKREEEKIMQMKMTELQKGAQSNEKTQNMSLDEYINMITGSSGQKKEISKEDKDSSYYSLCLQLDKIINVTQKIPESKLVTQDNFDDILLEILNNHTNEKLTYLLEGVCISLKNGQNQQDELEFVLNSLYNYVVTCVLYPESFDIQVEFQEQIENLNIMPQQYNKYYTQFYEYFKQAGRFAIEHFFNFVAQNNEEELDSLLFIVLKRAFSELNEGSILKTGPFNSTLDLMEKILIKNEKCMLSFLKSSLFNQNNIQNARMFQMGTLVGRLLSMSSLPQESKLFQERYNFSNVQQLQMGQKSIDQYQQTISGINYRVYNILNHACKQGQEYQKLIISWMYQVLKLNKAALKSFRQQIQLQIASQGFLFNFEQLMLHFSYNITEKSGLYKTKLQKFDFDTFIKREGFFEELDSIVKYDFSQELENDDKEIVEEQQNLGKNISITGTQQSSSGSNVFLTNLIKITMGAIYLNNYFLDYFMKFMQRVSQVQQQGPQSQEYIVLVGQLFCIQIQMRDQQVIQKKFQFLSFLSYLYLYYNKIPQLWQNSTYSSLNQEDKIDIISTEEYKKIFEFGVEIMYSNIESCILDKPEVLQKNSESITHIVKFLILVMGNKTICFSPHLRSKMLRLMSFFIPQPELQRQNKVDLSFVFNRNKVVDQYLIESLLMGFVDCEKTGESNQFYDKFQYRESFSQVVSYLFTGFGDQFRSQFIQTSQKNKDKFLQFANLFLNDINYFFGEIVEKCEEIKKKRAEIYDLKKNEEINKQLIQEKQQAIEQEIKVSKIMSKWFFSYTENLVQFSSFSEETFMAEEIRDKMVNNIDFIIQQLNQKEYFEKINIPELQVDMKFDKSKIMTLIFELYANFGKYKEFQNSIVNDQRCFSIELFRSVFQNKTGQLTKQVSQNYQKLLHDLEITYQEMLGFEEMMEDEEIPDEFLDPLCYEIMKEPVLLPTSKKIMDKLNIVKHLLNDRTDPFNRAPLEESQLIPQTELKKRIEDFVESVKQKKINKLKEQQEKEKLQLEIEQSKLEEENQQQQQQQQSLIQFEEEYKE